MRYKDWIRKGGPVEVKPRKYIWGLFYYRKIPVALRDLPVSYWMQLKDIVFEIRYAPYILSIYLDVTPKQVIMMNAGVVVAIYNHVKIQVEKCNRTWLNIHEILLHLDDGVDKEHWKGLDNIQSIYDLAGGNILKADEIEKESFAKVVNWMRVKLAYVRSEQNAYLKEKAKLRKS
jgi:hypothetical protein